MLTFSHLHSIPFSLLCTIPTLWSIMEHHGSWCLKNIFPKRLCVHCD
jgi:hypothetical protein